MDVVVNPPDRLVLLRPLRRDEPEALLDLFERLSPRSRQRRFLTPKPRLTARDLEVLMDVDGDHHDALAAVPALRPDRLLGVARVVRHPVRPFADVSVAVADAWQGCGLGRHLLTAVLRRAEARGIGCVSFSVLAGNEAGLRLAKGAGKVVDVSCEAGVLELLVVLQGVGARSAAA
jgi:RimJ/RimL family protein N-acetyltransferase